LRFVACWFPRTAVSVYLGKKGIGYSADETRVAPIDTSVVVN